MPARLGSRLLAVVLTLAACGPARNPPAAVRAECPANPMLPDGASRFGALVIDGEVKARGFPVVRVQVEPPTYDVVEPGPAPWVSLDPARISLVRFVTGPAAEAEFEACPGVVVIVVTTTL